MPPSVQRASGIEWCVASRPLPGQSVSGDQHVVAPGRDGVLLAAIDGLGHGEQATLAARRAADVLARSPDEPVVALLELCHRALRDTRGAAMTVLSLRPRERVATAVGVGNVEAMLVRVGGDGRQLRQAVLLRNGVVGYRLPALQPCVLPLGPGDVLVFATDGVREDFGDRVDAAEPVDTLVERVLAAGYRGTDDALVLACRVLADDEK